MQLNQPSQLTSVKPKSYFHQLFQQNIIIHNLVMFLRSTFQVGLFQLFIAMLQTIPEVNVS